MSALDGPPAVTVAQIGVTAEAEMRRAASYPEGLLPLVFSVLRIIEAPHMEGAPLGPCEAVYYRRTGYLDWVIVYTVDEYKTVTVEAVVRGTGL